MQAVIERQLSETVRDDAMRSVPKSEESQRFRQGAGDARKGREVEVRASSSRPSGRPRSSDPLRVSGARADTNSLPQSPMIWAAIGAGAMLLLGGAILLIVLLLR